VVSELPKNTESATAEFTVIPGTPGGVQVKVTLTGCEAGYTYPIHIHAGNACTDSTTQLAHWGVGTTGAGDGIDPILCVAGATPADSVGTLTYQRLSNNAMNGAWTVGGAEATNIVNHVLVVHNPNPGQEADRIACGVITAQ
jgi:Cu/Zn superoxide dismutase